jgi:DNA-binding CsgD family transcriptional regulator
MTPCIAIIDHNTLSSIALREIITANFSDVEVMVYGSLSSFIRDSNRHFIHFFVSADILFRNIDEFETLTARTTVLSEGQDRRLSHAGYNVLDISLEENALTSAILRIQLTSRYEDQTNNSGRKAMGSELSQREKEVLRLMIKGLINKEIAEKLEISLPTVIFHRNNICDKLQTRSIGKLTIYAVLSGLIDINDI